jgi:hypothetical protein
VTQLNPHLLDGYDFPELLNPCRICGKFDSEKPMCFKGENWCCENHRKLIERENQK